MSAVVELVVINVVGIAAFLLARALTLPLLKRIGSQLQNVIWVVAAVTVCYALHDHVGRQAIRWSKWCNIKYSRMRPGMTPGQVVGILGKPDYFHSIGEKDGVRIENWYYAVTNLREIEKADNGKPIYRGDAEVVVHVAGAYVERWGGDVKNVKMMKYD